jgi:hypothetical protein
LTNYRNVSAVGVLWNHALSDLHGIYALLADAARAYRAGPGFSCTPPLFDRRLIWPEVAAASSSDRPPAEGRNGIVRISRRRVWQALLRYLVLSLREAVPVMLVFDEDELRSTKRSAERISTYDVVNATLLKLYAACAGGAPPTSRVGLYFPIDVRGLLGVGARTLANCLGNASSTFALAELRSADVGELAARNRAVVAAYDKTLLLEDIRWADYWRRRASRGSLYHHWLFGCDRVYSSNWVAPELDELRFGDARFLCIVRSPQLWPRLPLPLFHSTILPHVAGGRMQHLVRVTLRRRDLGLLERGRVAWPHVRSAVRLDTGGRVA